MFPYGALTGIVIALSRQQQGQVSGRLEQHLLRLELDACEAQCELEHARVSGWLDKELVRVRQGMAIGVRGDLRGGLALLRPLHVDQFAPHEKARFFAAQIVMWMLLGRLDAARDVVEVDGRHLRVQVLDLALRERLGIANAAWRALSGEEVVRSRGVLERAARRSRRPLHRLLGLAFLARLEREAGRTLESAVLLAEAARVGPRTFAASLLAEAAADGQGHDPRMPY